MEKALAGIPAGSWTTYGDLAALIGSHPVPVGVRLASHPRPNAYRFLQVEGTVSPSFRWPEPARTDDPQDLLRAEGVVFDQRGRADLAQRLLVEDLAQLAGLTVGDLPETLPVSSDSQDPDLRDRFIEQLSMQQEPETVQGVLTVLDSWTAMGGLLLYGQGGQTSCFLIARDKAHPDGNIWPVALYPLRSCEVVFQHLRVPPRRPGKYRRPRTLHRSTQLVPPAGRPSRKRGRSDLTDDNDAPSADPLAPARPMVVREAGPSGAVV
jgi:alkylated DNA nucleotide flippase Atl1